MERAQNQIEKTHCIFEPITPQIEKMRVVTVDNLIKEESHFSQVARSEPDFNADRWLRHERKIASLAMANIESNIRNLVKSPIIHPAHLSELNSDLVVDFDPDAIVLSGTLRDFDYYDEGLIEGFNHFIKSARTPVLAICGGHQLVGQSFGARVLTLDYKLPSERRHDRPVEYQYRYVKITNPADPIFAGIDEHLERRWQNYTKRRHLLRVWQNHGLQLDRLPEGFKQLARGYLSEMQMIVKRTKEQLIYGVQFHIEKSFQDWQYDRYWDHRDESRDGRLIFENFLIEALRFRRESQGTLAAAN